MIPGTPTKYSESRASWYNNTHYDTWHILKCTYTVGEATRRYTKRKDWNLG